jgi:hypothetical protein
VDRQSAPARGERVYAGIGSRATPPHVLEVMQDAASRFARAGWTMRTGMSPGADQAFYRGAVLAGGRMELFLPWPAFEARVRCACEGHEVLVVPEPTRDAYALAARFHPGWGGLTQCARRLRARDCHQVLGRDLISPALLVVCWTPDGSLDGTGRRVGGTGQALRIARDRRITVLNLARPGEVSELMNRPAEA